MQKSNQRLNSFISEITSGEASPIPNDEEDAEVRIWSGEIAEINEATYSFYATGNAGAPKISRDAASPKRNHRGTGAERPLKRKHGWTETRDPLEAKPANYSATASPAPFFPALNVIRTHRNAPAGARLASARRPQASLCLPWMRCIV